MVVAAVMLMEVLHFMLTLVLDVFFSVVAEVLVVPLAVPPGELLVAGDVLLG